MGGGIGIIIDIVTVSEGTCFVDKTNRVRFAI